MIPQRIHEGRIHGDLSKVKNPLFDAFDVPNLDDFGATPEELGELAEALETLSIYAEHKSGAVDSRRRGRIAEALREEECCDALYARLPGPWKW